MDKLSTIQTIIHDITIESLAALDDERRREDLMGLYSDIRAELRISGKDRLIYAYADLLHEETELHSPLSAYEAGAVLGSNPEGGDKDKAKAFMRYVCYVELDPTSREIHAKVGRLYNELCALLGNTHGLIDEFTKLYRECNGFIQNNIERFFMMGYDAACCNGGEP